MENNIIQTINKPNKEGTMVTYNNLDLRDLLKGNTIKVNNYGEPKIMDGEYGKRYMYKFLIDGVEVTTFVNETMKAEGPGIAFGKKVYEVLAEKTGDISITRTKQSKKSKHKGEDNFDLWSIKQNAETTEQVVNTAPVIAPTTSEGSLMLTTAEQSVVNSGLKGKPYEQIKEIFDAYSIPEARAIKIYEEYLK